MSAKIQFNGKDYASIEEMPADERRRYEQVMQMARPLLPDADQNGVPDVLEVGNHLGVRATVHTKIVVNDRTYTSPEELPPDLRQKYDEAMQRASAGPTPHGAKLTVTFSATHGSTARDPGPGKADARLSVVPPTPEPNPIAAESSLQRTLLAIASLIAIVIAAWLLFGHALAGRH
jgi:hypothetical protein